MHIFLIWVKTTAPIRRYNKTRDASTESQTHDMCLNCFVFNALSLFPLLSFSHASLPVSSPHHISLPSLTLSLSFFSPLHPQAKLQLSDFSLLGSFQLDLLTSSPQCVCFCV